MSTTQKAGGTHHTVWVTKRWEFADIEPCECKVLGGVALPAPNFPSYERFTMGVDAHATKEIAERHVRKLAARKVASLRRRADEIEARWLGGDTDD